MKTIKLLLGALASFLFISFNANSQNKVEQYWDFINNNPNYSASQFYQDYPVGMYVKDVKTESQQIEYLDSVKKKFNLTDYEMELLNEHNFVITERQYYPYCWFAVDAIWYYDLPLFVTSDLILDALHVSYNQILQNIEELMIIPKLQDLLDKMQSDMPVYAEQYSETPGMQEKLKDVDVYITIAKDLLKDTIYSPVYPENNQEIGEILDMIQNEQPEDYPLFSTSDRTIDFSQFTPRGHYTLDSTLMAYFKAMIWLGRTEFYLIAPVEPGIDTTQQPEDIQRQIIDAMILYQIIDKNSLTDEFNKIDKLIETMVGISDNVQLHHIGELMQETGISDPAQMLDMAQVNNFQQVLSTKPYADQMILSQILMSDPCDKAQIKPASSFLLFGQRFLIDSYVCADVVYDKIVADGKKMMRMLPSVYDVLFALGNDPASDFLQDGLNKYQYAKNLAAVRHLIDSYDSTYWQNSIYNLWLNAIRKLNTPNDEVRGTLPEFMQTASWNQKSMNTQLASWAQIRHDNILYGKQSYTGGVGCSNPYVYIEPVPDFYKAMADLGKQSYNLLQPYLDEIDSKYQYQKDAIRNYFLGMDTLCEKLIPIAKKEINGTPLSKDEISFLSGAYNAEPGCGINFPDGWIGKFYLRYADDHPKMYVVADIHTAPTDEYGNVVGWVKHIGTGPVNLGLFIANNWDGKPTAFCGPVMSFYEYTSLNFKRLNDDEWIQNFVDHNTLACTTPLIADLYTADTSGVSKNNNPASLPTSVSGSGQPNVNVDFGIFSKPNPFQDRIYINFKVPASLSNQSVIVQIFDQKGILVKNLFDNILQADNYSLVWDGSDNANAKVMSGEYFCRITIGQVSQTAKLVLAK